MAHAEVAEDGLVVAARLVGEGRSRRVVMLGAALDAAVRNFSASIMYGGVRQHVQRRGGPGVASCRVVATAPAARVPMSVPTTPQQCDRATGRRYLPEYVPADRGAPEPARFTRDRGTLASDAAGR